jgi:hypothetical protein
MDAVVGAGIAASTEIQIGKRGQEIGGSLFRRKLVEFCSSFIPKRAQYFYVRPERVQPLPTLSLRLSDFQHLKWKQTAT